MSHRVSDLVALKHRVFLLSGALSLSAWLSWAGFSLWTATPGPSAGLERPRSAARKPAPSLPEVHTLHEQGTSAYHARLFAGEDRVVLVTQSGFTTFQAGSSAEEHALSLGPVAVRHGDALVFWRSGSLREVSLSGQHERHLAALPHAPQYLLASEGRLAWIRSGREMGTSLQTLSGGQVRVVYESAFGISASVMRASNVYSVAVRGDGTWSIGRFDLDGQHEVWSETHRGRPPATLAVGPDGVYFYDGPQRGVRRLTFDLERETAVASGVVCSPLAVSSRVVCAQVGGLFEIPPAGTAPRFLASERSGPVTAVAVTSDHAFWVAENGDGRLVVRTVALPGL